MDDFIYTEAFEEMVNIVNEGMAEAIISVLNDYGYGQKKVTDYNKGKFDAYREIFEKMIPLLKVH